MKNFLLTAAALATLSMSASAQRMTIHEEFTGENCPPCASTNPGFWDLCNGSGNPSKLIHISYMVPIPSAGWYCNRTTAIYTARDAYYSVPFAPYGRYDGHVPNATTSSPGHPGYFTQADIDAEAAIPDSFTITMTSAWDATYANIITTVNVTCVTAWSGSGTTPNVVLHTALIKTDDFATSPGTNGETHFENVVQGMYPSVSGTTIPGTWTAGMTQTYTITAAVPSWVDKSQNPYMVSWIQDNNDKHIAQAAKSAFLTLDVDAATSVSASKFCAAAASTSVASVITLKNTGVNPLTSADIYYKYDAGTISAPIHWTGTLAAGATTTVAIPATTLTAGTHTLYDSVAAPNASADVNVINNGSTGAILVLNSTPGALPMSNDFEAATMPANWTYYDANGNGQNFATAAATAHTGATGSKAAKHNNFVYSSGEANYIIVPTPTLTSISKLTFWVAYAQYSSENDQLEVVYSSDCGANWTSVFSKSGSTLKTVPAQTTAFTPTAAQWRKETVDLSTVPAGALVAFRATSNYGNNLYVDDVNIANVAGVEELTAANAAVSIHPNPATDMATLTFDLAKTSSVQVQVVDVAGRVLSVAANSTMTAGKQEVKISTADLAAGLYNVVVRTENGVFTQPLSVAK